MKRSSVLKLREIVWGSVMQNDPTQIAVIPSGVGSVSSLGMLSGADESTKREVCKLVFVDFKNYHEDDGTAIANSIEARLELFNTQPVRNKIVELISEANEALAEGEAAAASD